MNQHNDNHLKDEADYQGSKIRNEVRRNQRKYYNIKTTSSFTSYRQEQIGELSGKTVLDLGCGEGLASLNLLRRGIRVIAIDISPLSIQGLQKMAEDEGLSHLLDARVMDAEHLLLEDDSIDVVLGRGILHHLPALENAIKEIYRVLKPGGHAVFHEPLGMNPFLKLYRLITPSERTKGETPLKAKQLNMIKKVFPNTHFEFFENATLICNFFIALRMTSFAQKIYNVLAKIDKVILHSKSEKITLFQKMSWIVVMKLQK